MMIVPLKPPFSSGIFQRHNIPIEWLVFISPNNNIYTYIYMLYYVLRITLYPNYKWSVIIKSHVVLQYILYSLEIWLMFIPPTVVYVYQTVG
jgi:hypothetical protein